MPQLVFEYDGVLVVDSRSIAERSGEDHDRWFSTVILGYQTQVERAFGMVLFQDVNVGKCCVPKRYALLTENQASIYMVFSGNTLGMEQCRRDLTQAFIRAKDFQKQRQLKSESTPYWYKRMKIALSDNTNPLQVGYFCVYREIMPLFAELETRFDYVVPDTDPVTGKHLIPDISIGKGFNSFMRLEDELAYDARQEFLGSGEVIDFRQPDFRKGGWFEGGKHYKEILLYSHVFPEASHGKFQRQPSYSYPEKYLRIFHYYLQEYWMPDNCIPYLLKRDPKGLVVVKERFKQLSSLEQDVLRKTIVGKIIPLLPNLPESA